MLLYLLLCIVLHILSGATVRAEVPATSENKRQLKDEFLTKTRRVLDDGSLLTMHQMPRNEGPGLPDRVRSRIGLSREALRERLDSIVLLLSRLGDRMISLETKQGQQSERIDNINYRITKLDLQGEERKGQLSEVSGSLRHRLQTSDLEMERVNGFLEDLKMAITALSLDTADLKTQIGTMTKTDSESEMNQGPRLQTVMAAIYGLRSVIERVQRDVENIETNLTTVSNITKALGLIGDTLVTKKDFYANIAELISILEHPMRGFPYQMIATLTDDNRGKGESTDCWELYNKRGRTKSGIYKIQPPLAKIPFFVYCDMETDGGGWTVLQQRYDGTENFAREWNDYKNGFGNLGGEFWIGNEKIYQITNHQVNELQISLGDFRQRNRTAKYSAFSIGPEKESFALRLLGHYAGDAGDSLSYHVGQKWSTHDVDNDEYPDRSCARDHTGAWWYKSCDTSNLNGRYLHGPVPSDHEYQGVYWYDYHGPQYSLWRTTMMVRRGENVIKKNLSTPQAVTDNSLSAPTDIIKIEDEVII